MKPKGKVGKQHSIKEPLNAAMKKRLKLHPDNDLFESLAKLEGLICHRTLFNECGTLILYLDAANAKPRNLTRWRLYIDAAWRVDKGKAVVFGYADDSEEVVRLLRELWNQPIRSVKCARGPYDLTVLFANKWALKVFTNSKNHEQWQLRRSDGFRIGIAPGLTINQKREAPDA